MDFRNRNYKSKLSQIEQTINLSDLTKFQKVTLLKQIEDLISHELRTFRTAFEKSYFEFWSADSVFNRWHEKQSVELNKVVEKNNK